MNGNAPNEYLRNAVLTATPEQLHLMLYDGAIRFCRKAKDALAARDFETSCESLLRAQQIVLELTAGLRAEVNPELCSRMAALYQFIYRCLVEANMQRIPGPIDDALKILEHQRETWRLVIKKLRSEGPAAGPDPVATGGPADSSSSRDGQSAFVAEG